MRNAGGQFAIIDLAGQRFGRLVALRACGRGKDGTGCVGCASVIVAVSLKSAVVSETVTRGAAVVYVLLTLQAGVSAGLRL